MDQGDGIGRGNFRQIATQQKKKIDPPFEIEGIFNQL